MERVIGLTLGIFLSPYRACPLTRCSVSALPCGYAMAEDKWHRPGVPDIGTEHGVFVFPHNPGCDDGMGRGGYGVIMGMVHGKRGVQNRGRCLGRLVMYGKGTESVRCVAKRAMPCDGYIMRVLLTASGIPDLEYEEALAHSGRCSLLYVCVRLPHHPRASADRQCTLKSRSIKAHMAWDAMKRNNR